MLLELDLTRKFLSSEQKKLIFGYLNGDKFESTQDELYAAFVLSKNEQISDAKINALYDDGGYKKDSLSQILMAYLLKKGGMKEEMNAVLGAMKPAKDIFEDAFLLYVANLIGVGDRFKNIQDNLLTSLDLANSTREKAMIFRALSSDKNQLDDLLEKAKVVVIVFDENQILSTEQIWEDELLDKYKGMCQNENNYIELKNQMRIHSSKETVQWIRNIIDLQEVGPIPHDELGYDLRVFESPQLLQDAIVERNANEEIGLSRIVATFDWEYSGNKKEEGTWDVTIGDWSMPWNLQLEKNLPFQEKMLLYIL